MPSYYYHLKFELYETEDPTAPATGASQAIELWHPSHASSVFGNLPSHPKPRSSSQQQQQLGSHRPKNPHESPPSSAANPATPQLVPSRVVDYSASRSPNNEVANKNFSIRSRQQWRQRSKSFPPPGFAAGLGPKTAGKDWRFGRLRIESYDLVEGVGHADAALDSEYHNMTAEKAAATDNGTPAASLGPMLGGAGMATKAKYIPLEGRNTEIGWGIVHLYREGDESAEINAESSLVRDGQDDNASTSASDEDGTILCIPAVPSYLSPSDFMGFVGEKWIGDVTHYRMVMTSRLNRYMVLMKFRDGGRAKDWRKEFDGRVFNSMEPEICHVTIIKSITIETPARPKSQAPESSGVMVNSFKPFPPPTADLIELPTCPVCLERMDDTTGLMTILCQHVFHCTCLQTWKGSGCPVCRATNPSLLVSAESGNQAAYDAENSHKLPFGTDVSNLCSVCDSTEDLWICLICGNVGCGRYKGGHAKEHWKDTAHSFSLELETQHVWDYAGDMWVHRLIREKGEGKVVELPSHRTRRRRRHDGDERHRGPDGQDSDEDDDVVPRAKLDGIGMEYTHLLTSQLESQRVYFEELVSKAADKAAKASAAAEAAAAQAQQAARELAALRAEHDALRGETVPTLERALQRETAKAAKAADLARQLGRSLQEEKKVGEGLLVRVEHLNVGAEALKKEMDGLRAENGELRETNRDLTMFISGQEKLRELEGEGKVELGELEGGTVSVPEEKKGRGKGKGKARG